MIEKLENFGYQNLIILDNASTQDNLLTYLHKLNYEVHFFNENYGHLVLWKCGLFKEIIENQYYVLTDPDVIPVEGCPSNFLELFYGLLQRYPLKTKVGFSLKIDDLPETYIYKYDVMRYESFFYEKKLSLNPLCYDAAIDTTFALYRPGKIKIYEESFVAAIRTGIPYMARHMGWYIDNKHLSQEEQFYFISGELYSTALNNKAMYGMRNFIIRRLLEKQENEDFYTMIKRVISKKYINNNVTIRNILKSSIFLLYRKMRIVILKLVTRIGCFRNQENGGGNYNIV